MFTNITKYGTMRLRSRLRKAREGESKGIGGTWKKVRLEGATIVAAWAIK